MNSLNFTFPNIYYDYPQVLIKCEVIDMKDFKASITTQISLKKRTSANAQNDLNNLNINTTKPVDNKLAAEWMDETSLVEQALKITLMAEKLGNLKEYIQWFDPKIEIDECDSKTICQGQGNCIYLWYRKKYFCNCTELAYGVNCSFTNPVGTILKLRDQMEKLYSVHRNI